MADRPKGWPLLFPVGQEAFRWIERGGQSPRIGLTQRFLIRWQSFWFARNLTLQRGLTNSGAARADPVFIMGLWRSGTTFLHELLGSCTGLQAPTTFQCMNPSSFRLYTPRGGRKVVGRPMDAMEIETNSPQEDEFANLALGVPTVYRGFFDPRRLPELTEWLDPESWAENRPNGWSSEWRRFLCDVMDVHPGRLVLKSPSHTFRIAALVKLFPASDYFWIVRDPIATFLSNRKMWVSMFERYALWEWEPAVLDSFLIRAFECAADALQKAIGLLSREKMVVISFEELTTSAVESVKKANERLALGSWDDIRAKISILAESRSAYHAQSYQASAVPEEAKSVLNRLNSIQKAALLSHGLW